MRSCKEGWVPTSGTIPIFTHTVVVIVKDRTDEPDLHHELSDTPPDVHNPKGLRKKYQMS